jgi:hypothetical protein
MTGQPIIASQGGVQVSLPVNGEITITIKAAAYPMVGAHWRDQLTGTNRLKWGNIYVDDDKDAKRLNRRIAMDQWGKLYRGETGNNLDECPGAMFVWDGEEQTAHVQPCDARSNQDLGRDMYNALYKAFGFKMAWYKVEFDFL